MRLPFSEKFLLNFYNSLEAGVEALSQTIPKPIIHPRSYIYRIPVNKWKEYHSIFNKEYRKKKFNQLIAYLKYKGYLKVKKFNKYIAIGLTKRGINKIILTNLKLQEKRSRPDRKWQMIIFDIPEKRRKDRDGFRRGLKLLGYQQLQKSTWVSSGDVLEETKVLIKLYKLEPFVQLLLLEKIKF